MHTHEFKKIKNGTGHFTHLSLENSELYVDVAFAKHKAVNALLDDEKNNCYVLYPGDDSLLLNSKPLPHDDKQNVIFLIDSTWHNAKKLLRDSPNIQALPKISFEHTILDDIKKYTKFISSDDKQIDPKIKTDLEKRFEKIEWMSTTKTAELAKILVDTTYYGWLINYAQITKMICEKEGIDFDEMWKFADEIHENLGNRPKMYPGIIGGHCVIPNLKLVEYENLEIIKKINELYEKFKK